MTTELQGWVVFFRRPGEAFPAMIACHSCETRAKQWAAAAKADGYEIIGICEAKRLREMFDEAN